MGRRSEAPTSRTLVTGPSGSGKSTLARRLRERKVHAVDADDIAGLNIPVDRRGHRLPSITKDRWRRAEGWRHFWDAEVLQRFLARNPDVVLCGAADNMFEPKVLELFDRGVFLSVPWRVLRTRLADPGRGNNWGSEPGQRAWVRKRLRAWPARARHAGFAFVDATLPLERVMDRVHRTRPRGTYVILRGPLGVGKTTLARALARELGAHVVSIDAIVDPVWDGGSERLFLRANKVAASRGGEALRSGRWVIFDGCFYWRRQISDLVSRLPYPHEVFTLGAPLSTCIERDGARSRTLGAEAARQVYRKVARFDSGVQVDATQSVAAQVGEIRAHFLRREK